MVVLVGGVGGCFGGFGVFVWVGGWFLVGGFWLVFALVAVWCLGL